MVLGVLSLQEKEVKTLRVDMDSEPNNAQRCGVHTESMGCLLMHPITCWGIVHRPQGWALLCLLGLSFALLRNVPREATSSLSQEPVSEEDDTLI